MFVSFSSQTPYNVNLLLAGFGEEAGPELFFLDYLASLKKMKFAAHGYGGMYTMSIMDKHHKPGIRLDKLPRVF